MRHFVLTYMFLESLLITKDRKNVNVISDTQQSYKKKQRLHVFSELFGSLAKNSKADMNLNLKQKFTAV